MTSQKPVPGGRPHVVIVGGGIAGLAAAWSLTNRAWFRERAATNFPACSVTVLEAAPHLGGKLQTSEFADVALDTGADAFLAAAPLASRLCNELGLQDELVSPSATHAWLWRRSKMVRFPTGTVLGIPGSIIDLARTELLPPHALARAALDYVLPESFGRDGNDPTIGHVVRQRMGSSFADLVVAPLVGAINACSIDELSLSAATPALAELGRDSHSLMLGARRKLRARSSGPSRPTFLAHRHGMAAIVNALTTQLRAKNVELRTSSAVTSLQPHQGGWRVNLADGELQADAVIVAAPAFATAELLQSVAPSASDLLSAIEYTSVSMIRMAYTTASITNELKGSGYLNMSNSDQLLTACSWASSKWTHLNRPGQVILRASTGRKGDDRHADMSDDQLISGAHEEMTQTLGAKRRPFAADVIRWPNAFPQYRSGHERHVLDIERALNGTPPIALCGAAYRGLGIPACIKSGVDAAEAVLLRSAVNPSTRK